MQYVGIRHTVHITKPQHDGSTCSKCVAKLGKSPCFGVNIGIKKETVTDTFVSITVSVMAKVHEVDTILQESAMQHLFSHGFPYIYPLSQMIIKSLCINTHTMLAKSYNSACLFRYLHNHISAQIIEENKAKAAECIADVLIRKKA